MNRTKHKAKGPKKRVLPCFIIYILSTLIEIVFARMDIGTTTELGRNWIRKQIQIHTSFFHDAFEKITVFFKSFTLGFLFSSL